MIAIAAVSANWVIGDSKTNKMPWAAQSQDLAFFKEKTLGKKILFGRKTFAGLPLLKERTSYVISKTHINDIAGIKYDENTHSVYIKSTKDIPEDVIVCGGATIYKQFLPECHSLYLTEFDFLAKGDIFFPYLKSEIETMFSSKTKVKDITDGTIWLYSK